MNKLLHVFLLFIICVANSNGQEDNYDINRFSVAIVPSAILNTWSGFQCEINYGFEDHWEVSLNTGYIYGKRNKISYNGYRFRPSLKYYFLNDYEDQRFYLEAGYNRRVTNEEFLDTYSMYQDAFFQDIINTRDRIINGGYVMYGLKSKLYKSNFYLDFGMGIGLGTITVNSAPIENAERTIKEFVLYDANQEGTRGFPIFLLHLTVGYDF